MSIFDSANSWIASNQALVVSAGIPIFTLIITGWASFLSHRIKAAEVRLSGRLKLSEYRRANFDELLNLSGRLQSLFVAAAAKATIFKTDPLEDGHGALLEVVECANVFLLRSGAASHQIESFSSCIKTCCHEIFHHWDEFDVTRNILGELRMACKIILDDEWSRIERELKGLE